MLRQQIEEGFDNIAEVGDEIRAILARNWTYLSGFAWLSIELQPQCPYGDTPAIFQLMATFRSTECRISRALYLLRAVLRGEDIRTRPRSPS